MEKSLLQVVDVFKCCIFTWGFVTTILPAFIIAGAIAAFVPASSIIKFLGAKTKKVISYGVSSIVGFLLSMCSCNIVPLFASIYKRGAGIGPAFTFLYAGPAINLVAMVMVFKVIGPILGVWRLIGVPVISITIGLIMFLIYRKEEKNRQVELVDLQYIEEKPRNGRLLIAFFGLLFAILILGSTIGTPGLKSSSSSDPHLFVKIFGFFLLFSLLSFSSIKWLSKEELKNWGKETLQLLKITLPIFIPVVFGIAMIAKYTPLDFVQHLLASQRDEAGNRIFLSTLKSTFIGAVFGELMYFPILTEVAFVKAFLKLGMDVGPALAILLAGPGTSLPGLALIYRFVGLKKVLLYLGLSILLETVFGTLLGQTMGDYICACLMLE